MPRRIVIEDEVDTRSYKLLGLTRDNVSRTIHKVDTNVLNKRLDLDLGRGETYFS